MSTQIVAILGAVFFAYPVIAGMVYRLLMADVPPEPKRCDLSGRNAYGNRCETVNYVEVSINHPRLFCDQCNAWIRWAHLHGWRIGRCRTSAMLWPLLAFVYVPRRLFSIGANIRAVPAVERRRESEPTVDAIYGPWTGGDE